MKEKKSMIGNPITRPEQSHNANGAMEYGLESADLLKIRKGAGVKDPFWIPRPGWKPGDSPVQDPILAKEIRNLQEDYEEELGKLKREVQELSSKKDESQAIVVSEQVDPVAKRLDATSRYFKRLGSLGFWGQLACTIVAAVILSFSVVITGGKSHHRLPSMLRLVVL
ncbi:hypothetical protein HanRHA438_Chr05g0232271 [Helianthus annuus]|uniref:Uncharacterized protein n=1 Tax=Helianthus annuus TaxID=4232 RepID=A0A251UR33_HELAN|nr:hypothetical protein HanXRQr2_Chr05g0223201 [Helianthus annuus]KAJ0585185.1 putative protein DYAD/AMEIO [Helianthus annuus]KAJ0919670.1 hypothetical protein HanRHA438_Chr05g0232271 [Helianthus annuus]KAJ0923408.1 hypothetical protein HanPSC8_Chr05g0215531 [Helianthus annuus]